MESGRNISATSGNQYPIYVGIWTNWSRGRVFGSTLTLSRQDADLLIAFTAFFIAFVTTRVWRIICFTLHRGYSTADPRDAIYHQRQTIFRNSSSPESGIQMLIWLLWANRHSKEWLRPLPAAIAAILCITIFTVAGGFSSRISSAVGDEVLIKTSNCGYPQVITEPADPLYLPDLYLSAAIISKAANYVQQCYSNENAGLLDCSRFAKQYITNNIDKKANCPFKSHVCRSESANLRIDSGYLDSHDTLGVNAPPDERILFRSVLHCAPLKTTGFAHERNSSIGKYVFYQYGNYSGSVHETFDWVYAAPSVEAQYAAIESNDISVSIANYDLRNDADLVLIFLSGDGVVFSQYSDDEWYYLNPDPITIFLDGPSTVPTRLYIPTEPASPLGCTSQYQFCNTAIPGTSGCGPLASLRDAIAGASPLFDITYAEFQNNSVRGETAARFLYFTNMYFSSAAANIGDILEHLGATALTSQRSLQAFIQGPIASNQWQQDVAHWWDISMAIQQSQSLDQAYSPDDPEILPLRFNYSAPEFKKLCTNQKIRTTAYASFSMFGLSFTATVGLLLTLISYLLEPISGWLHKRKGYNKYPHLEWTTNSTLQLQRLAHEELGFGTWSEGTETIPVTKPGQLLGSLDISDPKHPVLCRPTDEGVVTPEAESSSEVPLTVVGDDLEHTSISLHVATSDASDAHLEVNVNDHNDSTADEIPIEEHHPNTEAETQLASRSPLSEQTPQPANIKPIQIAQGPPDSPTAASVGTRMQQ
ncbi:hypothetical protein F5Y08DRAFT_353259 [Xylaria arbuscula]|nr:hypothetical protein F5Y08DRAFT_353259 [Xylaria arbuscula]